MAVTAVLFLFLAVTAILFLFLAAILFPFLVYSFPLLAAAIICNFFVAANSHYYSAAAIFHFFSVAARIFSYSAAANFIWWWIKRPLFPIYFKFWRPPILQIIGAAKYFWKKTRGRQFFLTIISRPPILKAKYQVSQICHGTKVCWRKLMKIMKMMIKAIF